MKEPARFIPYLSFLLAAALAACATPPAGTGQPAALSNLQLQQRMVSRDGAPMVLIPGGRCMIGSEKGDADERPPHPVVLNPFYMDVHEVTVAQYSRYMAERSAAPPMYWNPDLDKPDEPVVGVSWQDAAAYAAWAGKRLPTEAEWEHAARGGNPDGRYPWGDTPDPAYANFESFGLAQVEKHRPNGYGLHDMIGNVWEWCADWYLSDYYEFSPAKNPTGPRLGVQKVLRGGAWYCDSREVRPSNRFYALPDARSFNTGFRCVQSVK